MSKRESFFLTSYSDLMTSLFFVILVLFVLSLVLVKHSNAEVYRQQEELRQKNESLKKYQQNLEDALKNAQATIEQQKRILRIDEQFKPLIEPGKFMYYPKNRKFVAKDFVGVEIFSPNSSTILSAYRAKTVDIGKELESQLRRLYVNNPDFKYQLVIEGNVANTYDNRYSRDGNSGYLLSYERALAVYQLWRNNGINLRQYNTEVLICGSGWNGIDRDPIGREQ